MAFSGEYSRFVTKFGTVRVAAVQALAQIGQAQEADQVVNMLSDAHPSVRREAVLAMGKLADAATRQTRAIEMLKDPDPTVRQAAAESDS